MESGNDAKQEEIDVINESKNPLYEMEKEDVDASLQQTLKVLKKQEADMQDSYETKHLTLQATLLDQEVANGATDLNLVQIIDSSIRDSEKKLHSAKMELASVLRETLKLKRKTDSFPVQSELIQYELRFAELNHFVQEKHCQTRNLYSTYNALLEIKELMLKDISLLNSINSQRPRKAEIEIQKEQALCDAIKERQAHSSSF